MLLFSSTTLLILLVFINLSHGAYPQNLLIKDDCLFAYVGDPIGSYRVTFTDGSETQKNELKELTYDSKTSCAKDGAMGNLIMNFKGDDVFDTIGLEFHINSVPKSGIWEVVKAQLKIKARNPNLIPSEVVDLKPASTIYGSSYESFSCSSLVFQNSIPTKEGTQFKITLKRFQVQPFLNPDARYIFSKSHDCSAWLTLPQIMAFLLLLFILFTSLIGVYLLLELGNHTSDLKFSKLGGMLMNQAQLDATKGD